MLLVICRDVACEQHLAALGRLESLTLDCCQAFTGRGLGALSASLKRLAVRACCAFDGADLVSPGGADTPHCH